MNDLDRRISIAPMMDYADARNYGWLVNKLRWRNSACSSFVAAIKAHGETRAPNFEQVCQPVLLLAGE